MFFRDFLFRHLPAPGPMMDKFGPTPLLSNYSQWWGYSKKVLTEWHYDRLTQIDSNFRFNEATRQLVNAREEARKKGIGPADPKYPHLPDFLNVR